MSLNTLLTGIFLDGLSALPSWEQVAEDALSERHVRASSAETELDPGRKARLLRWADSYRVLGRHTHHA